VQRAPVLAVHELTAKDRQQELTADAIHAASRSETAFIVWSRVLAAPERCQCIAESHLDRCRSGSERSGHLGLSQRVIEATLPVEPSGALQVAQRRGERQLQVTLEDEDPILQERARLACIETRVRVERARAEPDPAQLPGADEHRAVDLRRDRQLFGLID
jgi:hypothetical protein